MSIQWDMIIGGLGLFLFGIKFMGDGLKSAAGEKLRDYIDKYTTNPFMAVLVGAIITVMIQSSSATSAIAIGLVRAGLMKLEQAAGIVMGANLGTTVTAFLIGLSVEDMALYFVFVGAIILCFSNRKKLKYLGEIILGFGLLFYGLKIMGDALKTLMLLPQFKNITNAMSNTPVLAMIAGAILTAIIQSSSAFIGIIQKTYESGGMSLLVAIAFVFGSNIGTTITGVIASIGGTTAAKRTAFFNTFIKTLASFVGMLLLIPYMHFIEYLTGLLNLSNMMQIAVAHIVFNVIALVVLFPFLRLFCNITRKIIKGTDLNAISFDFNALDSYELAQTAPTASLGIAHEAIVKMSNIVVENVLKTQRYMNEKKLNAEESEIIRQNETLINSIDVKLTDYLLNISRQDLITDHNAMEINEYLQTIKNLERIGDITINLLEFYEMVYEDKGSFSNDAYDEINEMLELFFEMYQLSFDILDHNALAEYEPLLKLEDKLDNLEFLAREKHFKRMNKNECDGMVAGSVYCDILSNIERMGDHCINIARVVFEGNVQ